MKGDVNDTYEAIIEAAVRRFSYFGVLKTTMTEIAEDVSITKQALGYYFTDKQSLVNAVVRQAIDQYLSEVEQKCAATPSVEEALITLTAVKKSFFERYYMLYLQNRGTDLKIGNSELQNIKAEVRIRELNLITTLLNKGIESGEIGDVDVTKTGNLVLDALSAFECALKVEKVIPEHQDFLAMIEKQQEMIYLLMNGLKKPSGMASKH